MNKRKMKKSIIITGLVFTCILLKNNSYAALQSNGETPTKQGLDSWLYNIRTMESTGGTLGLNETVNVDTLLPSIANGLDIHMEKNTEYGAMTILAASAYGKQGNVGDGQTTTGNKTGVVIKINNEMTAAGTAEITASWAVPKFGTVDSRYKNLYTKTYSESKKNGDSCDIGSWQGGNGLVWLGLYNGNRPGLLLRAHSQSMFSYYGTANYFTDVAHYDGQTYSRAVIVVGDNL